MLKMKISVHIFHHFINFSDYFIAAAAKETVMLRQSIKSNQSQQHRHTHAGSGEVTCVADWRERHPCHRWGFITGINKTESADEHTVVKPLKDWAVSSSYWVRAKHTSDTVLAYYMWLFFFLATKYEIQKALQRIKNLKCTLHHSWQI